MVEERLLGGPGKRDREVEGGGMDGRGAESLKEEMGSLMIANLECSYVLCLDIFSS